MPPPPAPQQHERPYTPPPRTAHTRHLPAASPRRHGQYEYSLLDPATMPLAATRRRPQPDTKDSLHKLLDALGGDDLRCVLHMRAAYERTRTAHGLSQKRTMCSSTITQAWCHAPHAHAHRWL